MNIQAQPGLPPFPFISSMAAASKPEKAPDNEADAKKVATLSRRVAEKSVKSGLLLTLSAVPCEGKRRRDREQGQEKGHLDLC